MDTEGKILEYKPDPIDLNDITLDSVLLGLSEVLAGNVHETWCAQRMAQGWRYGENRDDNAKLHPGLVPFSELPEIEKEYDRMTAMNTLRLLIKLGFTICPPTE